jgi:lipid-binding SYLF domain-containing protein
MKNLVTCVAALSIAFAVVTGCNTAPKGEEAKAELQTDAEQTLAKFKRADPSLDSVLADSVGYAIFPSIGKGGLIAGAAYGRGSVYEKGQFIGYADIRQGSVGAQIGGQEFAQLVVFKTPEALYKFKNNNFTFGAEANAVALKEGAAAATEWKDGVAVFAEAKSGLMAGAALTGQKFTFVPKDVAGPAAETAGATTQPAK